MKKTNPKEKTNQPKCNEKMQVDNRGYGTIVPLKENQDNFWKCNITGILNCLVDTWVKAKYEQPRHWQGIKGGKEA